MCGAGRHRWKDVHRAKPYAREFREDVIRVARNREPGVRIKDVAADFGISESCLQNWLTQADRDDGIRSGPTTDEQVELREAKKRIRLLEQENEVLRRAAAYLSQAQLPGK
jgi:transposase-like protein